MEPENPKLVQFRKIFKLVWQFRYHEDIPLGRKLCAPAFQSGLPFSDYAWNAKAEATGKSMGTPWDTRMNTHQ